MDLCCILASELCQGDYLFLNVSILTFYDSVNKASLAAYPPEEEESASEDGGMIIMSQKNTSLHVHFVCVRACVRVRACVCVCACAHVWVYDRLILGVNYGVSLLVCLVSKLQVYYIY